MHILLDAQLAVIRDLLSDCFATMRGSVADMLPSGWELAQTQSLATVDPNLMAQREKDFFVCVDGTIFAKEFAAKAKAMKTLSLEKVSRTVEPIPCNCSNVTIEHRNLLSQQSKSIHLLEVRSLLVSLCFVPTAFPWPPSASSMNNT